MANTRSAKKRTRVIAKRTLRNRIWKSAVRTAIRRFNESVAAGREDAELRLRRAVALLDKAASRGVFHKNMAARKKGRLSRRLHQAQSQQQAS